MEEHASLHLFNGHSIILNQREKRHVTCVLGAGKRMATIEQIMTRELSVISKATTIQEAAGQMHDQLIGSLLVKEGEEYSGIITEADIVRAVAQQMNVAVVTVEEVMSSPILTVEKNLSPHYARDVMGGKRIRHLAVTDTGAIVGIVSARDLLAYFKTVSKEIE